MSHDLVQRLNDSYRIWDEGSCVYAVRTGGYIDLVILHHNSDGSSGGSHIQMLPEKIREVAVLLNRVADEVEGKVS